MGDKVPFKFVVGMKEIMWFSGLIFAGAVSLNSINAVADNQEKADVKFVKLEDKVDKVSDKTLVMEGDVKSVVKGMEIMQGDIKSIESTMQTILIEVMK